AWDRWRLSELRGTPPCHANGQCPTNRSRDLKDHGRARRRTHLTANPDGYCPCHEIERMLGHRACEIPRAPNNPADILFLYPVIEDADGEKTPHGVRADRRVELPRKLLGAHGV